MTRATEISVIGLRKHFVSEGQTIRALDNVDLRIPANSIFTLLGPSGCGKTTLLRCIVGLETPDAGEIRIGDEIVWSAEKKIHVPTEKRKLGMVFQTYAIWPHMNVFNNVAYPLQVQKLPKSVIRERVAKTLAFVQLEGFGERPAPKLSGGQQQRVALARALVAEPKVILFDEPLSNLDAKLRDETRKELKSFLSKLEITAVYVTHDRLEALALSDTIAVMRSGKIVETGNPRKIYFNPESGFVADFIGRSNRIRATVRAGDAEHTTVDSELGTLDCAGSGFAPGTEVTLCIRPESIRPQRQPARNSIRGTVESLLFVGDTCEVEIRVGKTLLMARFEPDADFRAGDEIVFAVSPEHCHLVEK